MTSSSGVRFDVPVAGGTLAAFALGSRGPEAPTALAIHGIASSSRSWLATATALGDSASLIAVDLRGRAASNALPEPFGIDSHVRDMLAVLDYFGLQRAVVVGHSLGAYIASSLAVAHPDRVSELVLVDGGLAIPGTAGVDPAQFTEVFLGPTFTRLTMRFPDRAAYRAWWANHPALADSDMDPADLEEYADHDLIGVPPELHSSIDPEVVRADGRDLLRRVDAPELNTRAVLLCAPRGLVDDPNPIQPVELVREWAARDPARRRAVEVPDVNHYTIAFGRRGAEAVAAEVLRALAGRDAAPARTSR